MHLVPPPLKARNPGPRSTPDQPRAAPGPTSSTPAPLSTPDFSPHQAEAPLPPPPRNPTRTRSRDRAPVPTGPRTPTPCSQRTPTAQDYEDSPGPITATSPHVPHTHTHTSAQGNGPAHGQWWQHWTHTQLLELLKWARASPPSRSWSTGPARGRQRTATSSRPGDGCHKPHGEPC